MFRVFLKVSFLFSEAPGTERPTLPGIFQDFKTKVILEERRHDLAKMHSNLLWHCGERILGYCHVSKF